MQRTLNIKSDNNVDHNAGFRTICLIGHRTVGKTTTGRLIAQALEWKFTDLDAHIQSIELKTAAELVAEDPVRFRSIESQQLANLLKDSTSTPRIIAVGAGCETLPIGPLYVWLERDGWQESARTERERLHPELDFTDELQTMITQREPRWRAAAHIRYRTPRNRTPERAAGHLAILLSMSNKPHAAFIPKTYLVPSTEAELTRAKSDADTLGMAGVEIRSDIFVKPPKALSPHNTLASLRTNALDWLDAFDYKTSLDIDIQFIATALTSTNFSARRPTRLILSIHPDSVDFSDFEALLKTARQLESSHPHLSDRLILKYAPYCETITELQHALEFSQQIQSLGYATTFLPQNPRFSWLRPLLSHGFCLSPNVTNYMPVGIAPPSTKASKTWQHYDLQKWLPHLTARPINSFDALIGDPVDTSIGEIWHRTFAETDHSTQHGYVAIPVSQKHVGEILPLFHQLGFRGLSVTSPLKRAILEQADVENPENLPAANTLRRTQQGWVATDTDFDGMTAALQTLQQAGIQPGPTAIFGRGGVSPAIERALIQNGWPITDHISARAGWPPNTHNQKYQLIINAAGSNAEKLHQNTPQTAAWLDLHYNNVAPPPTPALHLAGDIFFEAQARAQRKFWLQSNE